MTRTIPDIDQQLGEDDLEDAFTPPAPPPDRVVDERPDDGWDHRASKFSIAPTRTVVRGSPEGPKVLGHRDECIDCKARGKSERSHQFHLQASKDRRTGEWRGPEAGWFETALADGLVNGSPQAQQWQQSMALRMATLGVAAEPTCRSCRRDLRQEDGTLFAVCPDCHIRNGMPELLPQTTAQVAKVWARDFRGGVEGVQAREAELLRNDIKVMADAFKQGGDRLAEAIEAGVTRGFEQAMNKLGNGDKPKEK